MRKEFTNTPIHRISDPTTPDTVAQIIPCILFSLSRSSCSSHYRESITMEFQLQGKDKGERRDVLLRVSVHDCHLSGLIVVPEFFLSPCITPTTPFIITHFHSVFSPFPRSHSHLTNQTRKDTTEFWIKK
jgi:hypothetical protein